MPTDVVEENNWSKQFVGSFAINRLRIKLKQQSPVEKSEALQLLPCVKIGMKLLILLAIFIILGSLSSFFKQ